MKKEEAVEMASHCLNCKHRPCMMACPMKTNVPGFISKIKEEKFEEAYDILIENNMFSFVCSIICPQERQCQGSCVRGIKGEPIPIGKLEHFINRWARENHYSHSVKQKEKTNRSIAIVGSGPAGLSCAKELVINGCSVTIYEKEKEMGRNYALWYSRVSFRKNNIG